MRTASPSSPSPETDRRPLARTAPRSALRSRRRGAALGGLLLLLAACGGGDAPGEGGAGTGAGVGGGPGAEAPAGGAGLEPDALVGDAPTPGAGQDPEPGTRSRTGFEPGGPIPDSALSDYHVVMEVAVDGESAGNMAFELWGDRAPITVRNFLRLCDEGFYDGLTFHRVLRTFMVQGGCPDGTGAGNSPHGTIQGELSTDLDRDHRYGVLSMARMGDDPNSASSQFFICCDDTPPVWNLDGKYASFGRLARGVEVLERLADTPVTPNRTGEVSVPTRALTIVSARPVLGPAPSPEQELRRPGVREEDVEVPRVVLHTILVGTVYRDEEGRLRRRTPDELAVRAEAVLARLAEEDADFDAVAVEETEMLGADQDPNVIVCRLLHEGLRDIETERDMRQKRRDLEAAMGAAAQDQAAGRLSVEEYQARAQAFQAELMTYMRANMWFASDQVDRDLHAAAFDMEVGEQRVVPYDPATCPKGTWIVRRVE